MPFVQTYTFPKKATVFGSESSVPHAEFEAEKLVDQLDRRMLLERKREIEREMQGSLLILFFLFSFYVTSLRQVCSV